MTTDQNIHAADAKRRSAMVSGDKAQLEAIFSDRLRWTHSSGKLEDRDAFIASITSGAVQYLTLDVPDMEVMPLGGGWLCVGELSGRAVRDGVEKSLQGRFLSAWAEENGTLKMVAWQTTPMK
jgi:hypothetical protein